MDPFEENEFELDFCICLNVMDGMEYDKAREQALIDIKEGKE